MQIAGAVVEVVGQENEPFLKGSYDCYLGLVDILLEDIGRLCCLHLNHSMVLLNREGVVQLERREGDYSKINFELLDQIVLL